VAASDVELLASSANFLLLHIREAERKVLEELQTKASTPLVSALRVFDSHKREAQYREIQKQILKKWTIIPLLFGSEASGLWSQKLRTVPAHPFGYHMLPMESVEMAR